MSIITNQLQQAIEDVKKKSNKRLIKNLLHVTCNCGHFGDIRKLNNHKLNGKLKKYGSMIVFTIFIIWLIPWLIRSEIDWKFFLMQNANVVTY